VTSGEWRVATRAERSRSLGEWRLGPSGAEAVASEIGDVS